MWAAISHKYGHDHRLGTQPWLEDSLQPGHFRGNPSLSVTVSQYMISLGRQKVGPCLQEGCTLTFPYTTQVRAGEVVTSARAMDEQTMKELYEYNVNFTNEDFGPTSNKWKAKAPQSWAGSTVRLMLQLMFITAMLLLLRFEEVLRITWSDVRFEYYQPRRRRIRLMLPFHKTHQYGGQFRIISAVLIYDSPNAGIVPFFLYQNPEKPWMCPVHAWAAWWHHCRYLGLDMNGYVFRKKMGRDGVSVNPHDGMVSYHGPRSSILLICCCRLRIPSSSASAITCSILALTPGHMGLILSVAEVVSTWPWCFGGHSVRYVRGGAGLKISTTPARSSSTFSRGLMHPSSSKKTTSIPTELGVIHVQLVAVHARAHEFSSSVVIQTKNIRK